MFVSIVVAVVAAASLLLVVPLRIPSLSLLFVAVLLSINDDDDDDDDSVASKLIRTEDSVPLNVKRATTTTKTNLHVHINTAGLPTNVTEEEDDADDDGSTVSGVATLLSFPVDAVVVVVGALAAVVAAAPEAPVLVGNADDGGCVVKFSTEDTVALSRALSVVEGDNTDVDVDGCGSSFFIIIIIIDWEAFDDDDAVVGTVTNEEDVAVLALAFLLGFEPASPSAPASTVLSSRFRSLLVGLPLLVVFSSPSTTSTTSIMVVS